MEELKTVFISLPMHGKSNIEIATSIVLAKRAYIRTAKKTDLFRFCHNFQPDIRAEDNGAQIGKEQIWYLGKAIEMMSKCNEVFFYGDWKNAKGCIIEHEICEKYGIPFTEGKEE